MAHGFNDKGGNTSFVSKRELPWHSLGKVVDAMTSKECMELAGLDFTVGKAALFAGVSDKITDVEKLLYKEYPVIASPKVGEFGRTYQEMREVQGNFATFRTDTNAVFGVVGSRYEIVQNIEAFEFFDSIIGEGNAAYETAGALGNGETVFITAKLPSKLLVNKEDIDKYLLFTMAHDGSGSINILFTPIRVVCNNTLSAALSARSNNRITIRHTKNYKERLDIAHELLGIVGKQSDNYEIAFNRFKEVKIDDKGLITYLDAVFGFDTKDEELSTRSSNKRDKILEYYEVGVGQEGIQGTLWGAYNAVTGYLQNGQDVKNNDTFFKNTFMKSDVTYRNAAMQRALELS